MLGVVAGEQITVKGEAASTGRWHTPKHGRRKTALYLGLAQTGSRENVSRVECDAGRNFTLANQLP